MDLGSLLKANVELQKRVATDRALRDYFSRIWSTFDHGDGFRETATRHAADDGGARKMTFYLPPEMCELLALEVEQTGKTPSQIMEDSFAQYYLRKYGRTNPASSST